MVARDEDCNQQTLEDEHVTDEDMNEMRVFNIQSYGIYHLRRGRSNPCDPIKGSLCTRYTSYQKDRLFGMQKVQIPYHMKRSRQFCLKVFADTEHLHQNRLHAEQDECLERPAQGALSNTRVCLRKTQQSGKRKDLYSHWLFTNVDRGWRC